MAKYTITPWRTQTDLLLIRQNFYQLNTDSRDLRRQAVDRVMAWKLRGNLPHAVESTALLVDAILHHNLAHNSIFSIRAVYSAAFTRFVTGFCDIGRNRERALEPSSMLDIARQIDMPPEFVALRHEATHEELPSVQRLVVVCGQALEWLWRVYWSRIEEPQAEIAVPMSGQHLREESRRAFKEYRSAMRKILKQKSPPLVERTELVQRTSQACLAVLRNAETAASELADVLVTDKILFPSDRRSGSPMNGAFILWDDLLLAITLNHNDLLPKIIEHMFSSLSSPVSREVSAQDPEQEAVYLWLVHITTSEPWTPVRRGNASASSANVMARCCLHPGYWPHKVGEALLAASDNDFVETWSDTLKASAIAEDGDSDGLDESDAYMEDVSTKTAKSSSQTGNGAMGLVDPTASHVPVGWREMLVPPTAPIGMVR